MLQLSLELRDGNRLTRLLHDSLKKNFRRFSEVVTNLSELRKYFFANSKSSLHFPIDEETTLNDRRPHLEGGIYIIQTIRRKMVHKDGSIRNTSRFLATHSLQYSWVHLLTTIHTAPEYSADETLGLGKRGEKKMPNSEAM